MEARYRKFLKENPESAKEKPDPDANYTDENDGEDYDLPDTYDDSDYSVERPFGCFT